LPRPSGPVRLPSVRLTGTATIILESSAEALRLDAFLWNSIAAIDTAANI
jgi:hypothetical protein